MDFTNLVQHSPDLADMSPELFQERCSRRQREWRPDVCRASRKATATLETSRKVFAGSWLLEAHDIKLQNM